MSDENIKLKEQNKIMQDALLFYAEQMGHNCECGIKHAKGSFGKKAREALEKLNK